MDFLETSYQPKTPISVKLNQAQDERNAGEVFHKRGSSFPGPICEPYFPSIKKGWRATTSDQPEGADHINTLQTFQDGRAPSIKGNFGRK